MNKSPILSAAVLCCLLLTLSGVSAQNDDVTNEIARTEAQSFRNIRPRSNDKITRGFDMKYHRFEWQIDPAVREISGTVFSRFQVIDNTLSTLQFDLTTQLTVDKVSYHGVNLSFTHQNDYDLIINLPGVLHKDDIDSISVTYHGVPAQTGFGSFIQESHSGVPIIWTLSEPNGAKDWWPCKLDQNDKIDSVDYIVTVPSGNRVASNGLIVSENDNGVTNTVHWKHRYPIDHYLICVAVTNYAEFHNFVHFSPTDSMLVQNMVYPENLDAMKENAQSIEQQVLFYSSLFGKYPFSKEKYGHAQFSWGGGMEHQTMSFMIHLGYDLMAHELGHQWFGDKVTCGSWEDIWLNEGFATFLTGLCTEKFFPQNWYNYKKNKITSITSQPDGSVKCPDINDPNRIFDGRLSYNKGSMVLHMLRWELGDSAFFKGLYNYINDPDLVYNTAVTSDLRAHLEAAGNRDLTEFFKDWYEGEGFPSYTLTWSQDKNNNVTLRINQSQSHHSVSFYEMHVPVLFKNAVKDTLMVFDHKFDGQTFTFNLPNKVTEIQFDPELWIVSENNQIFVSTKNIINDPTRISVAPNPAHSEVAVYFQEQGIDPYRVYVYDYQGRQIKDIPVNTDKVNIQVGDLPTGYYYIMVKAKQGVYSTNFVKY